MTERMLAGLATRRHLSANEPVGAEVAEKGELDDLVEQLAGPLDGGELRLEFGDAAPADD